VARIPANPKIYHLTHLRNLPQIVRAGVLWSDAKRIELDLSCNLVGMSHIKQRRLHDIEVAPCCTGTRVGDYVPFYFCPRSIMLYILHKGNHLDLDYQEGQHPIVHLQADLHSTVKWAEQQRRKWAFSDRNAGTYYANFYADLGMLDEVNWDAVNANQWSEPSIKEDKQAEFLMYELFPWHLIEKIGVYDNQIAKKVRRIIAGTEHGPNVTIARGWYY